MSDLGRQLQHPGGPTATRDLSRWLVAILALLLLSSAIMSAAPATAQVRLPSSDRRAGLTRALQATVLVLVPDNDGDLIGSGSGTIMDATKGTILTNYHVLGNRAQRALYNNEGQAIIGLMPDDLRGAPILKYRATLLAGDPELDLAVLQISSSLADPQAALPPELGLTAIPRGDSDNLMIGDTLYVVGYPGLGGNTVTMSAGLVSGFLDEDNDALFEWIKTDAEVNRGNSGGLAVNEQWQFIGVPSRGFSELETAGKISLIRTGQVALQFYEAALVGNAGNMASAGPRVLAVEYGEHIDRRNEVTRPRSNFASGIADLYASFAFAGFQNGQDFATVWYRDGRQAATDQYAWNEGEVGRSWVSLYDEAGLDDGFYELELILAGQSLYRGGVVVGKAPLPRTGCRFGEITFAANISDEGEPVDSGVRFGSLQTVYAFFPVANLVNGTSWQSAWFYEGQRVSTRDNVWDLGNVPTQWVSLSHPDGLPVGEFQLELSCAGALQQTGSFQITQRVEPPAAGISITGKVTDRNNKRRPVEGALVVLLQPGATIDGWVESDYSDALVHGRGATDGNGVYRIATEVMPGTNYSVIALHDGYAPAGQDAYPIPPDAANPYELNITMARN